VPAGRGGGGKKMHGVEAGLRRTCGGAPLPTAIAAPPICPMAIFATLPPASTKAELPPDTVNPVPCAR